MPVSPDQGSTGGGDIVTLTGSHFTGASAVHYGLRQAAGFTVVNDSSAATVTPSGRGPAAVTVTTAGGTGFVGTFFYLPPPSFRLVPPSAGPRTGGNIVTLIGVGLSTTSDVSFGTQAAEFSVESDGRLTVTVPASGAETTVVIIVRSRGGVAGGVTYTYLDVPTIDRITPDSGPVDGGNIVVITGTGFSYATGVAFDGIPALSYRIASDTEIDALLPSGEPGLADVTITTLGGTATATSVYAYLGRFAVLGGESVTNAGPTSVTGDLGTSPGVSVTGFPPGQLNGTFHIADADALQVRAELAATCDEAVNRQPDTSISGDLGGQTLVPGVYHAASSIALTGALTLDAQDDHNARWVFQIGSTLTTATASRVQLVNGASARNVIWLIGSSATLGPASSLSGRILAVTSITLNPGATVNGQVSARNGSVTLDSNTITRAW
ncbi:ice-binding family protein [Streptomyces sp. NBC_01166]|uniref:ice-binding family protein n=1 Tax=Streptomyces sp. NBC_01166 TaxID=2903755 RepID=UPI0038668F54|nr:ice-binding family protein [Streptomyces sp. NBC_01166]